MDAGKMPYQFIYMYFISEYNAVIVAGELQKEKEYNGSAELKLKPEKISRYLKFRFSDTDGE